MGKIHGNTHVIVLLCKFLTCKHKNMYVSMYFLHLVLTFTPHYIIMDKGLLGIDYGGHIILYNCCVCILCMYVHLLSAFCAAVCNAIHPPSKWSCDHGVMVM